MHLHEKAAKLVDVLLNTATLNDCGRYLPGWRFKALHGKLRGVYQIRIDDQYRIRFRWDSDHGPMNIVVGEFRGENE